MIVFKCICAYARAYILVTIIKHSTSLKWTHRHLTINSTNKRGKNYNLRPNTFRAYLYTAVEKLKSQKLCWWAALLSLPHNCRNILPHTGLSLSLSLSLSLYVCLPHLFLYISHRWKIEAFVCVVSPSSLGPLTVQ